MYKSRGSGKPGINWRECGASRSTGTGAHAAQSGKSLETDWKVRSVNRNEADLGMETEKMNKSGKCYGA